LEFWTRALQAYQTATTLVETDPDAAASRAYYAAFYAVSALFALEGKSFTRHSALEIAINRELVKSGRWSPELGKMYSFILKLRSTGDYGGEAHVFPGEAKEAVAGCLQVLHAVHDVAPEEFALSL
jgi:uncharacterized protein (UPF0332 family)